MRRIEMSDECWQGLLGMREGRGAGFIVGSPPEIDLYGPIAASSRFVLAQVGQSLDGRVATPAGDARDISGPDGIAHLHRCRALVDAVIVGVGTVRADNPRLSVRAVAGPSPVRVVIDCRGQLSGDEGLLHDGGAPVIVIQGTAVRRMQHQNAKLIRLQEGERGLDAGNILAALAAEGLGRVLVEGGARTIARFIEAGLVDRLHVTIAPLIIGSGPSGITLPPIDHLSLALRPQTSLYALGSDILFDCQLAPRQASANRQATPL